MLWNSPHASLTASKGVAEMRASCSLVPRPPRPAFVAYSTKSKGKAWMDLSREACRCWHHIQSAHIWVCSLPFTFLSLNSVRSFSSVCPSSPTATGSIDPWIELDLLVVPKLWRASCPSAIVLASTPALHHMKLHLQKACSVTGS